MRATDFNVRKIPWEKRLVWSVLLFVYPVTFVTLLVWLWQHAF